MSRVSKSDVATTLDRIAKNIVDAAGPDGIASRRDLKSKVKELGETSKTEAALTRQFAAFIDHRDYKTGARITAPDVQRAVDYAKEHLLAKYDVNNNGYSKTEVNKMSRTGQLAVALTYELKGIAAPSPTTPSSDLGKAFTDAAKDTYFISESDSQPAFISASFAASRAITGDALMEAFNEHLASAFDEQDRDLSNYTFELRSPAESAEFLKGLAEQDPSAPPDDYYNEMARGFERIKQVFDDNITDLRVMRVGLRDEDNPSEMGVDDGAYQYLVVGRTRDGKLAGVAFESVET